MTRLRTAYGRLVAPAGRDALDDFLLMAEKLARQSVQRARPAARGPYGRALVVGLGRLGSWSSLILGRLGIAQTLVDRDVVEAHNLDAGNCVFRAADIGMPKVIAARTVLLQHAPDLPVQSIQEDVSLMPESDLRRLAEGAGVVLGLIDEGEGLLCINQVLHDLVSVIYAAGHRGARSGDTLITRPGGACLRCLLNVDSPAEIRTLAGEATHGIDILSIAHTCVRVALVLLGDHRLGELRDVLDPAVNFILIENRRSDTDPRGSALRFLRIARRRACPVCGALTEGVHHERQQR